MKIVVLVEASIEHTKELASILKKTSSSLIAVDATSDNEINTIVNYIKVFRKSNSNILIIRFSGNTNTVKELGDNLPEMIVPISYNEQSKYYLEKPEEEMSRLLVSIIGK